MVKTAIEKSARKKSGDRNEQWVLFDCCQSFVFLEFVGGVK